uniref:Rho termination factor N-terminal domain-containing protein n=1 Tax=Tanacetum cinerariifolium TaxID=118510 RepID=A0A6L2M963_TANCI|nr:hypothetical protein [Tanacetum cinerariifolium]
MTRSQCVAINSEAAKQRVLLQAMIEKNKVEADRQFAEIMNALKALQPPTTLPEDTTTMIDSKKMVKTVEAAITTPIMVVIGEADLLLGSEGKSIERVSFDPPAGNKSVEKENIKSGITCEENCYQPYRRVVEQSHNMFGWHAMRLKRRRGVFQVSVYRTMDDYVWDDDLWGPPNYQATEDTKYGIDGCTCAYCLTYDEEKESALNEQICIEVLIRLISPADTDMTELEEELFELLIQLAKTDEEFSDLLRVNLNMKINILKSSIMELKGNASNCLSTSREPAQSTYEILKSLFGYSSQKKKKELEANPSSKKKEMGSSSNVNQTGKRKTVIITPLEEHTISQTIVKVKEENADYHCMSLVPKHTASSLRVASTCDMNREVIKVQLKSPIMTHDNVHITTDKGKSICQKPSLETQGKWKHQINTVKSQPDEESTGSTSIRLEESSREPNAKKSVNSELGFPVCSSKSENHQEPSGSLSLTLYSPNTLKRRERPTSPYQKSSSSPLLLEGPKPCNGELGFPFCSSKSENHQKPSGSLSLTVYSPNTLKRRERPASLCQKNSSSPLLLEGPKPLCTHETDVNNPHDMKPYTLVKLKAIAKRRGLKNYSKLKKSGLLELLGINVAEAKGGTVERGHEGHVHHFHVTHGVIRRWHRHRHGHVMRHFARGDNMSFGVMVLVEFAMFCKWFKWTENQNGDVGDRLEGVGHLGCTVEPRLKPALFSSRAKPSRRLRGHVDTQYWTTLAKRKSYEPQPNTDGIGAEPPYYVKKYFMDDHLPGEWEIARDAELNPFKDVLVFRKMVKFL